MCENCGDSSKPWLPSPSSVAPTTSPRDWIELLETTEMKATINDFARALAEFTETPPLLIEDERPPRKPGW